MNCVVVLWVSDFSTGICDAIVCMVMVSTCVVLLWHCLTLLLKQSKRTRFKRLNIYVNTQWKEITGVRMN